MRTSTSRGHDLARTLTRGSAVLAVAALATAATAAPALAATPESSTLVAPTKTGAVTSTWEGSFSYPGLDLAAFVGAADEHALTIEIPGKKPEAFFAQREATLVVDLTWDGGSTNDMDLYVYDAEGNEVASSAQGGSEGESVTIPVTGPVTYTVEVDNWLSEPGVAYSATATLSVLSTAPACDKGKGKKGTKKNKKSKKGKKGC